MQGKIIRIVSNQYTIIDHKSNRLQALAMGKVRKQDKPVVGDEVDVEIYDGRYCIEKILPRRNRLYRPAVANVDQAMIVMSAVDPVFSNVLVDRLVFLIEYSDIEPLIVVSKMDLTSADDPVYGYIEDYRNSGYQVILVGHDYELDELKAALKDKVTVLAGQSGVGKSSLLNKLDPDFALATQEISKALNRGKHTTRHTELYEVAGGWLADTPGFSSLDFSRIDALTMAGKIKDFQTAEPCRFNDCHHLNEPGCAIIRGVEEGRISKYRYDNYVAITELCNKKKEWEL
ncbi:MAG: ribosome small subunit-dependent GTPase A [Erysipelotrichaceae bacterium]|nr:ribosome small subunit-dependent GTPase A [Erysipelotrichaceae bacterium]